MSIKNRTIIISAFGWGLLIGAFALFLIGFSSTERTEHIYYRMADKQFEKYMELDSVLQKVANAEYKLDRYDCVHFSRDLVKELAKIGIKAEMILGDTDDNPENNGHMWVGIWVEAQTGEFVSFNSDYRRN